MRRLLVHLGGVYALAVVAFCTAGVFHDRPDWSDATRTAWNDLRDTVGTWTDTTAHSVQYSVTAWLDGQRSTPALRGAQHDDVAPAAKPEPPTAVAAAKPVRPAAPAPRRIAPPAPAASAPPEPQRDTQTQVAQAPRPLVTDEAIAPAQIARVRDRLRSSLSRELYDNFDLFIYVSKADHGPWAQRMVVFAKDDQALRPVHTWRVSTGREATEPDAHGHLRITGTPAGYYQLDPHRMIKNYRSVQWDAPMPHAMFFNWIRQGSATGLAIHGVEGDEIALLGNRASAGCVRLSPQSAQVLFDLVRQNYRGEVPRFAMNNRRYSTMSNRGDLMHNQDGELVFDKGYRVLVYIDGYGGEELVSALF